MTKRLLVIALLLISAVIYLWPKFQGIPNGVAPVVRFQTNFAERAEIVPGTPLAFRVYLQSNKIFKLGSFFNPWRKFVRLRLKDTGEELPWKLTASAEPHGMVLKESGREEIDILELKGASAVFEGLKGYYLLELSLSPEESKKLAAAKYEVYATLEASRFPFSRKKKIAESNSVIVTVLADSNRELEVERLGRSAEFYLKSGRFDEAVEAVSALLALKPESSDTHVLHGDALAGLGKKKDAMEAYRKALSLLPPSYDEPLPLLQRMWELGW